MFVTVFGFSTTVTAQEKDKQEATKESKAVYTCSIHPEVRSDKPGKCSKCEMFLVLVKEDHDMESHDKSSGQTTKEKIKKVKALLAEAKEGMYYNCCLKKPCDRCALDHQSCNCRKDLTAGKGVCSDCYAGWQNGEGKDIPGITKDKVKANFHSHAH